MICCFLDFVVGLVSSSVLFVSIWFVVGLLFVCVVGGYLCCYYGVALWFALLVCCCYLVLDAA